MGTLIFLYNILLIIICSVTVMAALLTFIKEKRRIFLYLTMLPACYIVELIILQYVFAGLLFESVNPTPETVAHISYLPVRIICYLLILVLDYFILLHITMRTWSPPQFLLFLPALAIYFGVAVRPKTEFSLWLFYSVRQFYRFAFFSMYMADTILEKDLEKKAALKKYLLPMTGTFLLNCSILLEDTLMIPHLTVLLLDTSPSFERNYSENFLWIMLCGFILANCIPILLERIQSEDLADTGDESSQGEQKASPPGPAIAVNVPKTFVEYYHLTPREAEIVKCLVSYKTIAEISEEMSISIGTVKTHMHNVYSKAEASGRNELIKKWMEFSSESLKEKER